MLKMLTDENSGAQRLIKIYVVDGDSLRRINATIYFR